MWELCAVAGYKRTCSCSFYPSFYSVDSAALPRGDCGSQILSVLPTKHLQLFLFKTYCPRFSAMYKCSKEFTEYNLQSKEFMA